MWVRCQAVCLPFWALYWQQGLNMMRFWSSRPRIFRGVKSLGIGLFSGCGLTAVPAGNICAGVKYGMPSAATLRISLVEDMVTVVMVLLQKKIDFPFWKLGLGLGAMHLKYATRFLAALVYRAHCGIFRRINRLHHQSEPSLFNPVSRLPGAPRWARS